MIDKKLWSELMEKWAKVAKGKIKKVVYQTPARIEKRLTHFCDYCLPHLKGMDVLEIGCNSAWFGYQINEVAKSYTGLEPGNLIADKKKKSRTDYYKQAEITAKEMGPKAKVINATVGQFCSLDTVTFDSLVMCFVLYHLSDKEISLLASKILPKCKTVVVQNRSQKRPKKHNSQKFWKAENIVKFLTANGFVCTVIWGPDKKFSEIIAQRPVIMKKKTAAAGNQAIKSLKKASKKVVKRAVKTQTKTAVKKVVKKKVIKKASVKKVVK